METETPTTTETLVQYAQSEFAVAAEHRDKTQITEDMMPWIERIESSVIKMLSILDELPVEDRSRWLAMSLFGRLSTNQVVTPLSGDESEWIDSGMENIKRNRRCPHVFMRDDGTAFDARAVVRLAGDGSMRPESVESRDIAFPYMPKQEVLGPKTEEQPSIKLTEVES